jgi:hypothetical protein
MSNQYEYGFMFHTIDIRGMGNINSEDGAALFAQELAVLS